MSGDAVEGGGDSAAQPQHLVVVLIGVRPDIDPARLVDAEARALWSPGPYGLRTRAHARKRDADGTPNPDFALRTPEPHLGHRDRRRTRARARSLRAPGPLASASCRPKCPRDGPPRWALSRGPRSDVSQRTHGLRGRARPAFHHRRAAWLAGRHRRRLRRLAAGRRPARRAEVTRTSPSAAAAQATLNMLIETLRRLRPDGLEWIGEATTSRTTTDVFVSVPHAIDRLAALLFTSIRAASDPLTGGVKQAICPGHRSAASGPISKEVCPPLCVRCFGDRGSLSSTQARGGTHHSSRPSKDFSPNQCRINPPQP